MACSPGINPSPLLQLQEVDSSKASEKGSSPELLTAVYSPPVGIDGHTICIPSPYTDGNPEYSHNHGPLAFYNPSMLSYGRAALSNSPSSLCSPLSPSLYWPTHHHNVSSLALHCPQSLLYSEPPPHAPRGVEPKPLSLRSNSSAGMLVKRQEGGASAGFVPPGKADMHFCAVCHDYASGYHYGVWSCEGCKAFFKRSIQGHNDYICPATNQCTIDKNRRKSCQACRLRTCYEVGMIKCGVRRERCSYRGTKHRRGPQGPDVSGGGGREVVSAAGLSSKTQRQLHLRGSPVPLMPPLLSRSDYIHHTAMSPQQFISRIMEAEPPDIYMMEDLKKPFTETSMMMSLTNLADKELVLMISWAKKIPGFIELSLSDQIQLLKCCWLEVLMLGLMWRSVDHPGKLIFSPDFKLNREEGHCVEGILEIFDMLLAATSRFRELKLQREEYVCLKAMILLNSSMCTSHPETADEVESRNKLLRLLDSVIDALVWAISKLGLTPGQQTLRLGHLTMLLSHIRHVSNKGMDHLSSMKRKNVVLVYDLLLEMLEANTGGDNNNTGGGDNNNNTGTYATTSSNNRDTGTYTTNGNGNSGTYATTSSSNNRDTYTTNGNGNSGTYASSSSGSEHMSPPPASHHHYYEQPPPPGPPPASGPYQAAPLPAETPILDAHLQNQTRPPQNSLMDLTAVERNGYAQPEQWPLDIGNMGPSLKEAEYIILGAGVEG